LRVRRFLRIALACEIEAIAAAVLAAALVAIVLLVDQSAELHYTIHATVSGCLSDSAGGNSMARPDSERADAQNGETTVHLVRTVSPRAFLFDPSGSQAMLAAVAEHPAKGCHIVQLRMTGPDVSSATSVWFLTYTCLALSMLFLAWTRMSARSQHPPITPTTRHVMHAALAGVALALAATLLLDQIAVDTLSTPAATDDPISTFIGSLEFMVVAIVLAPIAEEVWFRRFWLERFAKHDSATVGAIFVTGMFCALHVPGSEHPIASIVCSAALSLLCCIAYLRSRSVVPPLMLHSAYNATILISQA
jgi:membrane protease YdiL (CAAX protease family)